MANRASLHSPEAQARRDRAGAAEAKVKRLRIENDDLRKQVYRAQETARIADEEAIALRQSLTSMTQSRDTAVKRNAALQADLDLWRHEAEDLHHAATAPRPSLLERLGFGRSA